MESKDVCISPLSTRDIDLLEPLFGDFVSSQKRLAFRGDYWPAFQRWVMLALEDPDYLISIARVTDAIAGIIVARAEENGPLLVPDKIGYVSMLVVATSFRGRGIGKRLGETARQWFAEQGISGVQLCTEIGNEAAAGFWEEIGFSAFVEIGRAEV